MAEINNFDKIIKKVEIARISEDDLEQDFASTLKEMSANCGLTGSGDTVVYLKSHPSFDEYLLRENPKHAEKIIELSKAVNAIGTNYLWIEHN